MTTKKVKEKKLSKHCRFLAHKITIETIGRKDISYSITVTIISNKITYSTPLFTWLEKLW